MISQKKVRENLRPQPGRSGMPAAEAAAACRPAWVLMVALMVLGLLAASPAMAEPERRDYQSTPFWIAEPSIPQVLIILSKEYKMFYQAYAGLIVDFDGDGRIDTGFNPNAEYTGYFDSRSCYLYKAGHEGKPLASNRWYYADPGAYFERVGPTVEDDTTISRPSGLKGYIPSPRSVTGICRGVTGGGKKTFSGNWLNFMTSSRMDVIRKILYGGDRVVDSASETYLEASFVPPDAAVWGTDIFADNIWNKTPYNAYYDITKYTPFDKPDNGKAHYFARVRDTGDGQLFPALRMAVNVNIGTSERRYWDWVMQSRPVPNDNYIQSYVSSYKSFRIKVRVCDSANLEDAAYGCKQYPNGGYKPVGLLQEYGESDKMYFGLMTGGFSEPMRKGGGILRNHMDSMAKSINASTGQLLQYGLPWSISQLRISGRWLKTYDHTAGCGSNVCLYADHSAWGNPLGEMLYEGVRYMAQKAQPTKVFSESEVGDRSKVYFGASRIPSTDSPINNLLSKNSYSTWSGRPSLPAGNCVKPVILMISDIDSSYDGDQLPNSNDLNTADLLAGIQAAGKVSLPNQFRMNDYLDVISQLEGYGGSKRYLIAKGRADDCSAKSMGSLSEVNGICPRMPSYEGTYSLAAVAYYAHTHNFNPSGVPTGIDIYAVTMSAAFPELTFNIPDSSGNPDPTNKISVLPVNITSLNNSNPYSEINTGRILSYLNYFLYDWQLDKNGNPFSITIRVNFSDRSMADDWEMDVVQEYKVNLLTDASTSSSKRSTCSIGREGTTCGSNISSIVSGAFRGTDTNYYYFKNPDSAQNQNDFIEIKPGEVKGLSVESRFILNASGGPLGMGYTISGTEYDGTYIENSLGTWTPASRFNTPPTCPSTGASGNGCQSSHNNTRQIRTFKFKQSGANSTIQSLPSPLWLAAKYGGFKDGTSAVVANPLNGVPDEGEWERNDGGPNSNDPANFFQATNISDLALQLGDAFQAIAESAVTGTANSASINTILGGGQSIQTQYHTKYEKNDITIKWAGSVYSLFVDKWGNLREDTNGNGKLDLVTSPKGGGPEIGDLVVQFRPIPGQTKAEIVRLRDVMGNNTLTDGERVEDFTELAALWNVTKNLSLLSDSQIKSSRGFNSIGGRRVYSYYNPGQKADGSVNWTAVDLSGYLFNDTKASSLKPFLRQATDSAAQDLINYTLGIDFPKYRNRTVVMPWSGGTPLVWRLGDVMNSKPIIVGEASGNYHLLYDDATFNDYRLEVARRRQVAYFGSNDGFLHAINLGYFGSLSDGQAGFTKVDHNGLGTAHELGDELWAYVPTSVLPHLAWMADPDYDHGYYVDLKPYIVDVKDERGAKPVWRTLLIGGLRLGGRTINMADDLSPDYSYSEFFALDITDPDSEPKLMWRFSHQNLGLSTAVPTVVRGKGGAWYVVLPSGPTSDVMDSSGRMAPQPSVGETNSAYEGRSEQRARVFVIDALTGRLVNTPAADPDDDKLVVKEENSFFSDTFTPRSVYVQKTGSDVTWSNHTVYMGLTSRDIDKDTGAVYRLKMADDNGEPLEVEKWELKRLIKTDKPVTGAVNSAYDQLGNLWVVFGTGRVWSKADLNPCGLDEAAVTTDCCDNHTQYIFGIKEPLNADGHLTFDEVANDSKIADFSGIKVYADDSLDYSAAVTNYGVDTHEKLRRLTTSTSAGYNGYKRKLDAAVMLYGSQPNRTIYEIVVSQPKIDSLSNGNSVMVYTSYLTSKEICDPSGESFLNMVDTFTGLPAGYLNYFSFEGGDTIMVNGKPVHQITGVKSSGKGLASPAWIIKTAEVTVFGNTGFNSNITSHQDDKDSKVSNVISWREVLDMGFDLKPADLLDGL